MKQKPTLRRKRRSSKSVLRLPDLEHAKVAVLNSLNSLTPVGDFFVRSVLMAWPSLWRKPTPEHVPGHLPKNSAVKSAGTAVGEEVGS